MCVSVESFEGRCELILLLLQLNQQLCNYTSHSAEPRQRYGQTVAQCLEICQIYAKYSRGPFTEEIIKTEIVVPLQSGGRQYSKNLMLILFTVLQKCYRL